ncbi:oligopeptide transport system substrate-binding protein [Caldicoprobacter guelmensis]|uniref:peptide ABC transporter substrate-binding protein n=1 Tax=Caldicoprobacter guelmensis TaxID=1170224 RepID=UPI00195636C5|nr:peptide ABC transporter substrate-binding protein [Caldicoprobacter guelmensis]MBM7582749.1 oligopeptide transport system substrate-binding protein [Caldicoprobacter guelmensis]
MIKRLSVLLMCVFLVSALFTACSSSDSDSKPIVYNMGANPKTLDPQLNNAVEAGSVIVHCFEGLTRKDQNGQIQPGIAKEWKMNEDGTKFTFYLRDAKWSDGQPVTAHDFVYAWRRAVDPNTGAEYAYQLWYVKNGQAITEGKMSPEELGVKAVDDKTLEVELEAPCSYFLQLTAFPTLFPVRKDIIEKYGEGWANNPDTYITNGPMVLAEYSLNDKIVLKKSDTYWNKDAIKAKELVFTMIDDPASELSAFEAGEIDFADAVPAEEIPRLKEEGKVTIKPSLGTYFFCLNVEKPPLNDVRVRKALALAIDRQYIIDNAAKNFALPAYAWVPPGMPDAKEGSDFRKVGGNYISEDYQKNVEEARKLLAEAGYPNGQGFPELTLLYNSEGGHKAIAEAVQEMWKKNLGINIKLDSQEWAVFQETRTQGNYEIARHGWLGDYVDPMTMLDMWHSKSGQNDARWKNSEYDRLIELAKRSGDQKERMEAMHKAEEILMKEMPIIPVYYYTDVYLINPKIKGFYYDPLGFKVFLYATKE